MTWSRTLLALLTFLSLASCESMGARTIPRDRFDYSLAVADSWKNQTLLNIVKLRYCDAPVFLEVSQIVSGYTLESELSVAGGDVGVGDSLTAGARGRFTDRPTITYRPLTGVEFSKNVLTPIKPEAILFMVQSGISARAVFQICVQSINGVRNDSARATGYAHADTKYGRLLTLLEELQSSGALGMRFVRRAPEAGADPSVVLFFRSRVLDSEDLARTTELRQILGIDEGLSEITVVFGGVSEDGKHLSLQTRSMVQILRELSSYIACPPDHVAEGRVLPEFGSQRDPSVSLGLQIHSGASAPDDAYVSVQYLGNHFWIDGHDLRSKLVFSFALLLFSLAETGSDVSLPVLTIPT